MQPKTLKIFAIALVALSLALAFAGYRLSQGDAIAPPVTSSASQPSHGVVAATRELAPGETLKASDIAIVTAPFSIENSFTETAPLLGRTLRRALHKGGILSEDAFRPGGALAQETAPGLRAVAIRVDETSGAGGFLQPGDHVDVFYTVHDAQPGKSESVADVLVRNVRILAFGSELVERAPTKEDGNGKLSRSAVLEVPPLDVSRLLLAETNGVLRLAAIGSRDTGNDHSGETALLNANRHAALVTLNELSGIADTRKTPEIVQVIQGDQIETLDLNEPKQGTQDNAF